MVRIVQLGIGITNKALHCSPVAAAPVPREINTEIQSKHLEILMEYLMSVELNDKKKSGDFVLYVFSFQFYMKN